MQRDTKLGFFFLCAGLSSAYFLSLILGTVAGAGIAVVVLLIGIGFLILCWFDSEKEISWSDASRRMVPSLELCVALIGILFMAWTMFSVSSDALNVLPLDAKYRPPKAPTAIPPSHSSKSQKESKALNSSNRIPPGILEQWKKDAPRQWRENPLGQSSIGLRETFEAGICDQGIPDLAREIPGPWQNWGLQGARFGCPSNQFATQATLDFGAKGFSYASTHTIIPPGFVSQTMNVSIAWYSERTDGNVKWVVDRACVGTGQSLNAALIDAVSILGRPDSNHSLNMSSAKVSLEGCKPNDELIVRLAREGEDNVDTLSATAHVEKVSLDMRPQKEREFARGED
jgi:hypothetical protein